ncbi:MAG: hypothetical protein ACYDEN_13055, partial [Acidimicrobiales bacterium]
RAWVAAAGGLGVCSAVVPMACAAGAAHAPPSPAATASRRALPSGMTVGATRAALGWAGLVASSPVADAPGRAPVLRPAGAPQPSLAPPVLRPAARARRAPAASTPRRAGSRARRPSAGRQTVWVVRPGDSFWTIAEAVVRSHDPLASTEDVAAYWWRLVERNSRRLPVPGDPDLLYVGDQVLLPAPPGPA